MRSTRPGRVADHVVLVSIDGLRPEFAQDETWPAPTLQQLAWEGARADAVRSVFPALTYPAHATMVTGALPERHGVYFNEPFEPAGQSGRWHWESSALLVPTLWDAVQKAGLNSAAVSWPVTVGAGIDWNVPDVWPLRSDEDPLAPIRRYTTPVGLFEEIEREATGRLRPETFAVSELAREDRVGAIATYLFERYRPALLLMHLIGTDHVQHDRGRNNPLTRCAVGAVDRAIGALLGVVERLELRERTTFILTGDHGTSDVHTELRPNAWLVPAGLLEDRPDRGRWRAAFHASGGSAFLRLADHADGDAVVRVRDAISGLRPAERRLFRVVERDELAVLGADPHAALALAAAPGVALSPETRAPAIQPATGAEHGYHPDEPVMLSTLVAARAGIRRGAVVPVLPLQNIAPLVAALLSLEFEAPDGMLFPGILARQ